MSRTLTCCAIVAAVVSFEPGSKADFMAGMAAYARGDHETAFREMSEQAEKGHVMAQFYLGLLHLAGEGTPQDDAKAAEWFRRAAEAEYPEAQNNLGLMYQQGRGLPQDPAEGVKWLRRAAVHEYPPALNNLGLAYQRGEGVRRDLVQAYFWFHSAAESMDADDPHRQTALENRDAAAVLMSPEEKARAERLTGSAGKK